MRTIKSKVGTGPCVCPDVGMGVIVAMGLLFIGLAGLSFAADEIRPMVPEEEVISIESFFPSPWGMYDELHTETLYLDKESGSLPGCSGASEGAMYYDFSEHKVKVCDGTVYKELGGGGKLWDVSQAVADDIYYAQSGNVGIGVGQSDSAGAKLQVVAKDATKKNLILKAGSSSGVSGFSSSTPGTYSYVVPVGVSQVQIVAAGGKGGDGADLSPYGYPSNRGYGGNGGKVEAKVSVSSGATLSITVGARGGSASGSTAGGGSGNYARVMKSDGTVFVVGGGGGGAGGTWYYTESGFKKVFAGGNGGASGGTGGNGSGGYGGGNGGTGGSTSAGGVGGAQKTCSGGGCVNSPGFCYTYSPGGSGGFFQGGSGGLGGIIASGGGGGSGYYGGGGGTAGTYANEGGCGNNNYYGSSAGGGGGGANYIISSAVVVTNTDGINAGDGYVTITPVLGSGVNSLTEWQDNSGVALSAVDINGNFGIGASSTNGYKLYVNGAAYVTSGAWSASDMRFKENILPLDNPLDKILSLQGVSFEWNKTQYPQMNFEDKRQIGLIGQEVEKIIPEIVHTDSQGYKSIAYDKLSAVTIEAIKDQQKEIAELKETLRTQEERQQEKLRNQQKEIELLKAKDRK